MSTPVLLSATALIGNKPNIAVGVQRIDQLVNPSRTAMLVTAVRFRVDPAQSGVLGGSPLSVGSAVWCRLDLGRLALTAGRFIPLLALCPALDSMASVPVGVFAVTGSFLPAAGTSGSGTSEYLWQLPKPLYVPAGEVIVPQFYVDGDLWGGIAGTTVAVTYVGYALPSNYRIPSFINAPFATAWIDSLRAGGVDTLGVKSIRSDLKNPFGEDLYVQRMIGAYGYLSAAVTFSASSPQGPGDGMWDPTNTSGVLTVTDAVGNDAITTQIFKSNGFQVAKDKTPWSLLFPYTTRTLDMCGVLHRNEWFQLQSDLKLSTGFAMPAGDSIKLMTSLIGYRRVAYARGSGFVEAA